MFTKLARKIKLDGLAKAVQETLDKYNDEVVEKMKETVDEISKEAGKITKQNAPVNKGDYKKNIKVKTAYVMTMLNKTY